jgi:polyhydroxyalkanoate synthesis regulator phasin
MNVFGNIVQKAFYLGMGLASLATEKANATVAELREQATKLTEDLVERGEMTTDEARKFVDDLIRQAQQPNPDKIDADSRQAPRSIEILNDDDLPGANPTDVQNLKNKVNDLQEELRRIQK